MGDLDPKIQDLDPKIQRSESHMTTRLSGGRQCVHHAEILRDLKIEDN